MFKTLRGLAPPYLSDECLTPVAAYDHATRSVHIHACCAVDQTRLGDRSFAFVGLLPAWLRLMDNYTRFRRLLKAHLFHWGCGAYSDCFRRRVWIFLLLTYLLYRYVINPVISSPPVSSQLSYYGAATFQTHRISTPCIGMKYPV